MILFAKQMNNQRVVIGIVGEKGSGKGTVAKFIQEMAQGKVVYDGRFSDVLAETLKLWDIEINRKNLQDIAIIMRDQFGKDAVTNATFKRILNTNADIIILEGIRWLPDVSMLRKFPKNILLYVTTPDPKSRFERLKRVSKEARKETVDFDQFMKEEKAQTELFITEIGKQADYTILNDSSLEDLKAKTQEFFDRLVSSKI